MVALIWSLVPLLVHLSPDSHSSSTDLSPYLLHSSCYLPPFLFCPHTNSSFLPLFYVFPHPTPISLSPSSPPSSLILFPPSPVHCATFFRHFLQHPCSSANLPLPSLAQPGVPSFPTHLATTYTPLPRPSFCSSRLLHHPSPGQVLHRLHFRPRGPPACTANGRLAGGTSGKGVRR